ncbi:MAG: hypothetical protein DWQ05_22000 [Calditrichaeota bacterium]|nr:MAG: hypothetical protein DWQ05_22000 [Calditrichota bacterium]
MRGVRTNLRGTALLIVVLALFSFMWMACENNQNPQTPGVQEFVLHPSNPEVKTVMDVQLRHTEELMAKEGIIGTATGMTEDGKPAVLILAEFDIVENALAKNLAKPVPDELEGIPTRVLVTGKLRALRKKPVPPDAVSHQAIQTPPIQLGTSGGWQHDLANGYCCGGTLGSLIQSGGKQYILSNYHVFESDIVDGGNGITAQTGDPIIQPALIDVGCDANQAQQVATLVKSSSLPNNNVDASIAEVIPGMVDAGGAILEIGPLSAITVAASIGQAVKKSGRTTGLTRSAISGLNGTVSITYDDECAGSTSFTKTFTGQIIITNRASKFLAGGDSGSLMVEDVDTNPRAIGLLFAGSNRTAIANPINDVLSFFSATMVGN